MDLRSFSLTVQITSSAAASTVVSGIMSSFSETPQLRNLSLVARQQYRCACTVDLAPFTGLTSLKISNWHLPDRTVSSIPSLTHLRSLDLSHTCLGSTAGSSKFLQGINNNNNKHLRCGNRKGPLGRTDQTHHRMDPTQWLPDHQLKQY